MDGGPSSGVPIYDTYDFGSTTGWYGEAGTSLAAPMWAGIIAIADQGRVIDGLGTLDGPTGTLPAIYDMPSTDFHDITSGSIGSSSAGYSAGTGYDLVSGRGTPIVSSVVGALTTNNLPAKAFTGVLNSGSSITSPNGVYSLDMLSSGNLVEYGPGGEILWESNTSSSGAYAWMQSDGNLVVYANASDPIWSSETSGNTGAYLSLANNGTTRIKAPATGNFVWTGNTVALSGRTIYQGQAIYSPNGIYSLTMQPDGNLVEYGPGNEVLFTSNTGGKLRRLCLDAERRNTS